MTKGAQGLTIPGPGKSVRNHSSRLTIFLFHCFVCCRRKTTVGSEHDSNELCNRYELSSNRRGKASLWHFLRQTTTIKWEVDSLLFAKSVWNLLRPTEFMKTEGLETGISFCCPFRRRLLQTDEIIKKANNSFSVFLRSWALTSNSGQFDNQDTVCDATPVLGRSWR